VSTELDESERRELRRKARAGTLEALRALGGKASRRAISEQALSAGGFTARELNAPPPAVASSKYDRLVDHELSWALTNLKRDGLVENPRWSTWTLTRVAHEATPSVTAEPVDETRLAALRSMPYWLYLRTPEWRRTRAAALVRAGNRCSLDASHVKGLEVHHSSYERLGKELESDLTVLCRSCHARFHTKPERAGGVRPRLWLRLAHRSSRQPQA
jgi:hypothetical protein